MRKRKVTQKPRWRRRRRRRRRRMTVSQLWNLTPRDQTNGSRLNYIRPRQPLPFPPLFFLVPFPNYPTPPTPLQNSFPSKQPRKPVISPSTILSARKKGKENKSKKIDGYSAYCHLVKWHLNKSNHVLTWRQVRSNRKTQTLHDVLGPNPVVVSSSLASS